MYRSSPCKDVMEYTRLNKLTIHKAQHDLIIHVAGYAGLRPAPAGPITSQYLRKKERKIREKRECSTIVLGSV
jgi:hypothetical protein